MKTWIIVFLMCGVNIEIPASVFQNALERAFKASVVRLETERGATGSAVCLGNGYFSTAQHATHYGPFHVVIEGKRYSPSTLYRADKNVGFDPDTISCQILKNQHGAKCIGILDCDVHYGDGTDAIIKKMGLTYIQHWTFGEHYRTAKDSNKFIAELPKVVASFSDCDVVLYQAGADPHINDPLGGVLTSEQMRDRDRIVFEGLQKIGVPVAWNLADGYQKPIERVLELHTATLEECLGVTGV